MPEFVPILLVIGEVSELAGYWSDVEVGPIQLEFVVAWVFDFKSWQDTTLGDTEGLLGIPVGVAKADELLDVTCKQAVDGLYKRVN